MFSPHSSGRGAAADCSEFIFERGEVLKGRDHSGRGLCLCWAGFQEQQLPFPAGSLRPEVLAGPGPGQRSGPLLCSFVNPGSGEALQDGSRILFGKGWRTDCPKKDLAGPRGRLRAGEGARLGPSSFFFNRGMTQAPVISSLIGSNQFLQELPLINVGLLRSHSLGSQRCCLPGTAPAPFSLPSAGSLRNIFLLKRFLRIWGNASLPKYQI